MVIAEPATTELRKLYRRHEVLIVDDEPAVLGSLRRLLREEPYDIWTTAHPEMALRWMEEREVSLLITDERMPAMEGHLLIEEVKQRTPVTACVILTAYPESTLAIPGLREEIQGIITKPWDNEMIQRMIRQLLYEQELDEL